MVNDIKEKYFHEVVARVRANKFSHVTTVMVTEERLNQLKQMFICASVPYSGSGKCFLLCK
ncbi:MAG: hypothetical protein ACRC6V_01290 [Bacteroidales bacterium]